MSKSLICCCFLLLYCCQPFRCGLSRLAAKLVFITKNHIRYCVTDWIQSDSVANWWNAHGSVLWHTFEHVEAISVTSSQKNNIQIFIFIQSTFLLFVNMHILCFFYLLYLQIETTVYCCSTTSFLPIFSQVYILKSSNWSTETVDFVLLTI